MRFWQFRMSLMRHSATSLISGFAASRWEQQFLVKAGLPWWAFTVTFIATMVIVAVISDIYVLKIANSNPSESLKTE